VPTVVSEWSLWRLSTNGLFWSGWSILRKSPAGHQSKKKTLFQRALIASILCLNFMYRLLPGAVGAGLPGLSVRNRLRL